MGRSLLLEQRVAVEVGDRNFGGRDEEEFVVLGWVYFLGELGELAGPDAALALHDVGDAYFLVAVVAGLDVE